MADHWDSKTLLSGRELEPGWYKATIGKVRVKRKPQRVIKESNMKVTKKFYVASTKMTPGTSMYNTWAKDTVEEAVAHATELAQETEQTQMVVQIIKVIRPQRIPVTVEDVE